MRGWLLFWICGLGAMVTEAGQAPSFVGVDKCKPCHRPEFETWSQSAHASATESAKAAEGFKPECLACHATGNDGSLPGVQCEACHGPGSEYWPVAVMVHREMATAAGLILPGPEMCSRCHDGLDHHRRASWESFKHDHREKKATVELP